MAGISTATNAQRHDEARREREDPNDKDGLTRTLELDPLKCVV
jgi:hypothetical protein